MISDKTITPSHLIKLVWYVVNQYTQRLNKIGVDSDEAFSRGLVGLAYAVNKYNSTQGKFGSFAFQCIKREIFSFHTRDDYWNHFYRKIFAIRDLFYQRTGRRLANFELAKLVGVTEKFLNRANGSFLSLENNCNIDDRDGEPLQANLADDSEPAPQASLENEFVVEAVQNILNDHSILDNIERKVIRLYFGLPPLKNKYSQIQITILLNISKKKVVVTIKRALTCLRTNKKLQELYMERA